MELNPSHHVTAGLHEHWQKIAAIMMHKHGIKKTVITAEDLRAIEALPEMPTIVMHDKADGIHLLLLTQSEALEYIALNNRKGQDLDEKPGTRN